MAFGKMLKDEIIEWGILLMVIVILSVIFLKFKTNNVGGITCSGSQAYYNATGNICCNGTATVLDSCAGTHSQSAILTVGASLDTYVSAFSEPKNWLIIVIVSLIGLGLVGFFIKKTKQKKEGY